MGKCSDDTEKTSQTIGFYGKSLTTTKMTTKKTTAARTTMMAMKATQSELVLAR